MPRAEISPQSDDILFCELAPSAERLLNTHLSRPKEFYPHQEVIDDDFTPVDMAQPWSETIYPLDPAVRSALYVNLLTEDNLPYYTHEILGTKDPDHPFSIWGRLWTAEESRHSDIMRRWVEASGAIDPIALQDGHMVQLTEGQVPHSPTFAELIAYTSFQELATKVAHNNTAKQLGDSPAGSVGKHVLRIVAGDENRHFNFYSGVAKDGFEIDPSTMMIAAMRQLVGFAMPGTGIPNFAEHSLAIAGANIYGPGHFLHDVVEPTLKKWDIDNAEGLSDEGKRARDRIHKRLSALARAEQTMADEKALSSV